MRLFEYILKYLFLIGVSAGASIFLGPSLLRNAFLNEDEGLKKTNIETIQVDYLNGVDKNYLNFNLKLNGRAYKQIYRIAEGKHQELMKLIGTISEESREKASNGQFPIVIDNLKIDALYALGEKGEIQRLKVNNIYVIGNKTGGFKKVAMGFFGVLMVLMGGILFFLGSVHTILNIKVYSKTGSLPPLPNTIDDMTNGIKFLFGKSNESKND